MLKATVDRVEKESLWHWLGRSGLKKVLVHTWKHLCGERGTLTGAIAGAQTFDGVDQSDRLSTIYGTITTAGSYPAAGSGGDTLSFGGLDQIKSGVAPLRVYVLEQPAAGSTPSGYNYTFCPGTTLANGKLVLLANSGSSNHPQAELSGNPTYASLSLSPLVYEAVFVRV